MAVIKNKVAASTNTFANIAKSINARVFNAAKAKTKELAQFSNLPDGDYIAKLINVEFKQSKTSGKDMIQLSFRVLEEPMLGKSIKKFLMLDSEDSLSWALNDLARFGYDVDQLDPNDLGDILTELLKTKPTCKLALVTKEGSDRQNVYINQVLDDSDAPEDAPEAEPEAEDKTEAEEPAPKKTGKKTLKKAAAPEPEEEPELEDEPEEEPEAEEELEEEPEEEEVELSVKDKVTFKAKVGTKLLKLTGTVTKIDEKKDLVSIKTKDGTTHNVKAEAILSID